MGFLSGLLGTIGNVATGFSGANTILNGVSSLFGGGSSNKAAKQASAQAQQQFEYQKQLNEQQQEYARENASTEYQRQRELTRDTMALQTEGKIASGVNTALGDSSSAAAASVNPISAPSAGSAPDPGAHYADLMNAQNNGLMSYTAMLKQLNEAKGQEIQNSFDEASFQARLDKAVADGEISRVTAKRLKRDDYRDAQDFEDSLTRLKEQTNQAIIKTENDRLDGVIKSKQVEILDITKQMNEEQLKQLKFEVSKMAERYEREVKEQLSRIDLNKASAQNQRAAAKNALAQANLAAKQAVLADYQAQLEKAKIPYADRLAQATVDMAEAQVDKTINESQATAYQTWKTKRDSGDVDFAKNPWYGFTYAVGQGLRNLAGGILSANMSLK